MELVIKDTNFFESEKEVVVRVPQYEVRAVLVNEIGFECVFYARAETLEEAHSRANEIADRIRSKPEDYYWHDPRPKPPQPKVTIHTRMQQGESHEVP